jgi:methyl-accepting chemotaxis protein
VKISRKLAANAAAMAAGLGAVAAIGLYAVTSIQSDLTQLTAHATPLQARTLEVQERTERMLGSLLKLSIAGAREEAAGLSRAVQDDLAVIAGLKAAVHKLDPKASTDLTEFSNAHAQIAKTVEQRLGDAASYQAETERARASLRQAEAAVASIRGTVAALEAEAVKSANAAQQASQEVGHAIKLLLTAQARLKDVALVVGETDAVSNRFRLGPLKERMKAHTDALQNLGGKGDEALLKDLRQAAGAMQEAYARDGSGILALRAKVLAGDKAAEADYAKQKRALAAGVEEQLGRIATAVDALEVQVVKQRQALEAAFRARAEAGALIAESNAISIDAKEIIAGIRLVMLAAAPAEVDQALAELGAIEKRLLAGVERLHAGLARQGKAAVAASAAAAGKAIRAGGESVAKVAAAKRSVLASDAAAAALMQRLKAIAAAQASAGEAQVKSLSAQQAQVIGAVDARVGAAFAWIVGIAAAVSVLLGVLSLLIIRSITRPVAEAKSSLERIAGGDLTVAIEAQSRDEIGEMTAAMARMRLQLAGTVERIRAASEAISSASGEIASGNQDLSSRTEAQASSLQETASSMEELTATVRQNADNARQASQLAASASDVAAKGGQVVSQVVDTMQAINAGSKRIADIIGVIDGIAFQTNILALNAAVEAARAGAQGRGFAVVASEVRSLAQKSAGAAREIKGLIQDSVGKVRSGAQLVESAGATMQDIVASVKRVSDIVAEISAASVEQSSGIEQVNQAVAQMDRATQQNAALVEESAAAAEAMQAQAQGLVAAVGAFRLAAGQAARAPAPVPEAKAVAPRRAPAPARVPARVRVARAVNEG